MSDSNDIAAIIQAVPAEVAQEAYTDLAAPALQEGGKLAADIAKTLRLVLFPFQVAGALQDRLNRYIDRAIRQVPEAQQITPMESTLLPIAEKLRFQEENNPITGLYINLLSRAMDGERIKEVHPAFLSVISQLAPDEILFIREMVRNRYTMVIQLGDDYENWPTPNVQDVKGMLANCGMSEEQLAYAIQSVFRYETLNQPDLFKMFLDHLVFIGVVSYTGFPPEIFKGFNLWGKATRESPRCLVLHLSHFGRLFYQACVS